MSKNLLTSTDFDTAFCHAT